MSAEFRLECLRLAAQHCSDGDQVLAMARDYYRFALLGKDVVGERLDAMKAKALADKEAA